MSIFSWFSGSNNSDSKTTKAPESSPASACPMAHDRPNPQPADETSASRCPVDHKNMEMPKDHPFLKAQDVLRPGIKRGLSTEREISSIPRLVGAGIPPELEGSGHAAPDAEAGESNWVYPSPAQFYSALQRKHRSEANASDMSVIVPVHNAVNEKCWADVLKWELNEAQAKQEDVKLVSFKGRPQDLTPRARWYSLLGYAKPFDRHDWVVDRAGKRVRYVIDFYAGKGPLSFFLDVRPALDDLDAVMLRTKRFWSKLLPQQQTPSPPASQQTRSA